MSSKLTLQLMLVDPDDDLRFLLKTLLELTGCRVEVAKNYSDALAKIETYQPDLILTELFLDELTGLDFGRKMRSMPWAKDVLLVALTSHHYPGITQDAWIAGFDRFLLKPVQFDQILEVLRSRGRWLSEMSSLPKAAA
jgi:two-component system, sensor histidine kinase